MARGYGNEKAEIDEGCGQGLVSSRGAEDEAAELLKEAGYSEVQSR